MRELCKLRYFKFILISSLIKFYGHFRLLRQCKGYSIMDVFYSEYFCVILPPHIVHWIESQSRFGFAYGTVMVWTVLLPSPQSHKSPLMLFPIWPPYPRVIVERNYFSPVSIFSSTHQIYKLFKMLVKGDVFYDSIIYDYYSFLNLKS